MPQYAWIVIAVVLLVLILAVFTRANWFRVKFLGASVEAKAQNEATIRDAKSKLGGAAALVENGGKAIIERVEVDGDLKAEVKQNPKQ